MTFLCFQHNMSTPTYPQSNGKAEAAVKSMKKLIQAWTGSQVDEGRLARSLLQYRNTPSCRDNLSPSQKLFGRLIQDTIPAHHRAFAQEWQWDAEEADKQAYRVSEYVEQHFNQHAFSPILAQTWPFKILLQNVGIFMESSQRLVLTAIIASRLPVAIGIF